jgi:hypothetical protein
LFAATAEASRSSDLSEAQATDGVPGVAVAADRTYSHVYAKTSKKS